MTLSKRFSDPQFFLAERNHAERQDHIIYISKQITTTKRKNNEQTDNYNNPDQFSGHGQWM